MVECESLKREKEKNKANRLKEAHENKKEDMVYDNEVLMLRLNDMMMKVKKRRWMSLEFAHNHQVPLNHEGMESFIKNGLIGKTLIHRVYVDNGSSVNILYEHCLARLPKEVRSFIKPATLVGFASQSV